MQKKYKTKFPVARIKRIMQKDEDVGKVAVGTPVVISKAVEMFMQSLINSACKQIEVGLGSGNGTAKMTVSDLKRVILNEEQFDFLKDLAEKIPDKPAVTSVQGNENGNGASVGRPAGAFPSESSGGGNGRKRRNTSTSIKKDESESEKKDDNENSPIISPKRLAGSKAVAEETDDEEGDDIYKPPTSHNQSSNLSSENH